MDRSLRNPSLEKQFRPLSFALVLGSEYEFLELPVVGYFEMEIFEFFVAATVRLCRSLRQK